MNEKQFVSFTKLNDVFVKNNFHLFLVGGSVRDLLLEKELIDMDVATDATPNDIKKFNFNNINFSFERFGVCKIIFENLHFDIATFREENEYLDSRHPIHITFVKEMEKDYLRRDFTINAMYMDTNKKIYDFSTGLSDLENHLLRMIGNADKRIKEDPLRILRAFRFAIKFDLQIEESLSKAISDNIYLLKKLNPIKIKEELLKFELQKINEIKHLFLKFNSYYLLDMLK